jgi:F-type H+-transporting ATPase subunit epsilon
MIASTKLNVVSAEEELFCGEVKKVVAPGIMGDLGILPGHTQLITTIRAGELRYTLADEDETVVSLFVAGGILEVQPHLITVLSDTALRAEDLDAEKSQRAMQRAEDALQGKDPQDLNYEALQAELDAAKAQIEMIHRIGKITR